MPADLLAQQALTNSQAKWRNRETPLHLSGC